MEELKLPEHPEETRPQSIAEALKPGLKTLSTLVATYTAAVLAAKQVANGQAKSETELPSPHTAH